MAMFLIELSAPPAALLDIQTDPLRPRLRRRRTVAGAGRDRSIRRVWVIGSAVCVGSPGDVVRGTVYVDTVDPITGSTAEIVALPYAYTVG